jgi:hypothetical protein
MTCVQEQEVEDLAVQRRKPEAQKLAGRFRGRERLAADHPPLQHGHRARD